MSTETTETIDVEPEIFASPEDLDEARLMTKAKRFASKLPFVRHAVAMWYAMGDKETPIAAKGVIIGALAYFVLPVDLVPDFIAGFGFTDDAAVIAAALKTISSNLRPQHYEAADEVLQK